MDGFVSGGIAGILFAEDFGLPEPPPPPPAAAEPPPEPAPPPLGQADIDAACIRAVGAAERAWAESAAERRTVALEAIAAGLGELRAEARAEAQTVGEAVARAMLGGLAAVLPALCRDHGDGEVRAVLRHILPLLGPGAGITVRAGAEVLASLGADLAGPGNEDGLEGVRLCPANLPPGDLRVSWDGGSLHRDGAALRAGLQGCLEALGLLPPLPDPAPDHPAAWAGTANRSLSHVE